MKKCILEQIKKHQADAFLVFHPGEYDEKRLSLCPTFFSELTGFGGSFGICLMTSKKSYLFVDGRYIESARKQSSMEVVLFNGLTDVFKFISEHLNIQKILYDPWQLSIYMTENIQKKFSSFVFGEADLNIPTIDKKDEIFDYSLKYAGQSTFEKLSKTDFDCDVFLMTDLNTVSWLLNQRSFVLPYSPLVLKRLLIFHNKTYSFFSKETLSGLNGKKVGLDFNHASKGLYNQLIENGADVIHIKNPFIMDQVCKNETELENITQIALKESAVICDFLCWLEKNYSNHTEKSAVDYLIRLREKNELYQSESFPAISAISSHTSMPHYETSDAEFGNGGIYLIDTGAQYLGGTTDMTRTIVLGDEIYSEWTEKYTRVLKAHIALARATFTKDTKTGELDRITRAYVTYNHASGHGIGAFLSVHETPPTLSPNSQDTLKPGMVLSNEPGFYQEGNFGIRIENMMKVVENQNNFSFEMLTYIPMCDKLIDYKLLDEDEKMWLEKYRQDMISKISHLVEAETLLWLEK